LSDWYVSVVIFLHDRGRPDFVFRERQTWRCTNCMIWGTAVWTVRDGPAGPRVKIPQLPANGTGEKIANQGHSRFATTVVSCTNVTRWFLSGPRTYTAMTFLFDDIPLTFISWTRRASCC
jgi:hypothetical protein